MEIIKKAACLGWLIGCYLQGVRQHGGGWLANHTLTLDDETFKSDKAEQRHASCRGNLQWIGIDNEDMHSRTMTPSLA